ncbi:hypothetical protein KEM48_004117 [Puccinia striiformis f. sp. tritici PST-130]|nr:hypothetical protein KEM48_004117 [Puccinia striiformis f. sp. tritici PST-130]
MMYVKAQTLLIADRAQILHYPRSYYSIIKHQEATTRSELHHKTQTSHYLNRTNKADRDYSKGLLHRSKITVVSYNNT